MSRLIRLLGLWSLCFSLACLSGLSSTALAEPSRSPIAADVTQIDGYPFPAKISGLGRGQKTDYNEAGLGFSVRYENPGETWADIFVYDLGENLNAAQAAKVSADQRDMALSDIQNAVSAGSYQGAKVIQKSDAAPYAKAHLTITQRGATRDSFVFVTVAKNRFVKIRYTTSAKDPSQAADKFAAEYARMLKP